MRVTWISGWGVSPETLQAPANAHLPEATHCFLPPRSPSPEAVADSDLIIGWSLGAWRLLAAAAQGQNFAGRVILLAPFVAFCSEYGLGGRCSLTQVRWLKRWLQKDPAAALADFYQRAGLDPVMPYASGDLLEGLDCLAQDASPELRRFAQGGLPSNWTAVVGQFDPVLDAQAVCNHLRGCRVAAGARHRVEELLPAALGRIHHAV